MSEIAKLEALEILDSRGKVRYVGAGIYDRWKKPAKA